MSSSDSHIESKLVALRSEPNDVDRWEREWNTIEILLNHKAISLPSDCSILDIGCGNRGLAVGAARRGMNYRGIDISDGNFEFDAFPVEDSSVDLAVSLALIEHLHNPANLMSEVRRILKPGGVFFLSTPNWKYCKNSFYDNPAHVHPYTPKALHVLFSAYGLKGIEIVPALRNKPASSYFHKYAFQWARMLPFRGSPMPAFSFAQFLYGRATSIFAFGYEPLAADL